MEGVGLTRRVLQTEEDLDATLLHKDSVPNHPSTTQLGDPSKQRATLIPLDLAGDVICTRRTQPPQPKELATPTAGSSGHSRNQRAHRLDLCQSFR